MHRRRDERAASAIELSIVAPTFLLLIFTIVQGALWYYGRNVALSAAREGASYLRLAGEGDSGQRTQYSDAAVDASTYFVQDIGMLQPAYRVDATFDGDETATMTVGGTVIDLVPFTDLYVEQTVTVELEQFREDEGTDL